MAGKNLGFKKNVFRFLGFLFFLFLKVLMHEDRTQNFYLTLPLMFACVSCTAVNF